MKILLTGGGTGGHFYPLIAVAEALQEEVANQRILPPDLYFMGPTPYDEKALYDHNIEYVHIPAGKIRRYFSILNFTDAFKTIFGCVVAIVKMFFIFPDVVFGKGGYVSFPALFAAKFLRIPVIIHESDSEPGRVNAWAAKFATKVAISYPDAAVHFRTDQNKIAHTGNPIRKELRLEGRVVTDPWGIEADVPVILVVGGSQGAQAINDVIIQSLSDILQRCVVIHQTGRANISEIKQTSSEILKDHPHRNRYYPLGYIDSEQLCFAASHASLVISRAGSTIFEIAAWGLPSIIIPLPETLSHDQTHNARSYARSGAASIIEQNNLSAHVLLSEIERIIGSAEIQKQMSESAKAFARLDAANLIARAILNIALEHEQ